MKLAKGDRSLLSGSQVTLRRSRLRVSTYEQASGMQVWLV